MKASTSTAAPPPAKRRPFLEIQFHPGNIRWGIRYLFLTRRQLVGWSLAIALYLAFLVCGLLIAPAVVRNQMAQRRIGELKDQRAAEGEKVKQLVIKLAELEGTSSELVLDVSKIHLAYGLTTEARGTGGYSSRETEGLADPAPGNPKSKIFRLDLERGHDLLGGIDDHLETTRIFIDEIHAFEAANQDQVRTTPSMSPLRRETYVMTSPFGTRRSPFTNEIDFHAGIDLAATIGTPVQAPAEGVVTFAGRYPLKQSAAWYRYGNLVALRNGDRFMTLYGHCDEVKVKVGQKVKQGEVIATVGNSGWSTNPHLHYEVRYRADDGEWQPVDPRIYILDQRWTDEERVLIRARRAPSSQDYEPLPRVIGR